MDYSAIDKRYGVLAETDCCLSCGGAVNYAEASGGEVCVDLGSGRGTDVIRLSEKVGMDGYVYGIDITEGMILKARATAKRLGVTNVAFIKSRLEKIDLESGIADLVISNCTINHASDKQMVWNEIYRILKDGGRFVVSDIYSMQPVPVEFRNDPVAIAECWAGAVTREGYLEHLYNAGFRNINIIEESKPYDKGKIVVASWTLAGKKSGKKYSCLQ